MLKFRPSSIAVAFSLIATISAFGSSQYSGASNLCIFRDEIQARFSSRPFSTSMEAWYELSHANAYLNLASSTQEEAKRLEYIMLANANIDNSSVKIATFTGQSPRQLTSNPSSLDVQSDDYVSTRIDELRSIQNEIKNQSLQGIDDNDAISTSIDKKCENAAYLEYIFALIATVATIVSVVLIHRIDRSNAAADAPNPLPNPSPATGEGL